MKPKRVIRGLPALGAALDARARRGAAASSGSYPRPGLPGGPRLPLHLPPGTGSAMPSTLAGGSNPGGGGLPGGGDPDNPSDPHNPAYPEAPLITPSVQLLFQSHADTQTVANTTTETLLSGISGSGSLSLPADWWQPGRALEIDMSGNSVSDIWATGAVLLMRVYLNTTHLGYAQYEFGHSSGHAGRWSAQLRLVCWTTGGSSQFELSGWWALRPLTTGVGELRLRGFDATGATFDTSLASELRITATFGEALAGNSITLRSLTVKAVSSAQ